MMNELFDVVLSLSIRTSFVLLAIMAIRLCLKKAPKVISYGLMSFAFLTFLVPLNFSTPVGIMPQELSYNNLIDEIPAMEINTANIVQPENVIPSTTTANQGNLIVKDNVVAVSNISFSFYHLWLMGLVGIVIYTVYSYCILKMKLTDAKHYNKNMYTIDEKNAAFVLGIINPKIYLSTELKDEEFIIKHEEMHIKRYDYITKIIFFGICAINWFNPIMWLGFKCVVADIELSCDEEVVKNLSLDERKGYSLALLNLATNKHLGSVCPVAFAEGNTEKRIKNILSYKRTKATIMAILVIVCIVAGVMIFTTNESSNKVGEQGEVLLGDALDDNDINLEDFNKISLQTNDGLYTVNNDGGLYAFGSDDFEAVDLIKNQLDNMRVVSSSQSFNIDDRNNIKVILTDENNKERHEIVISEDMTLLANDATSKEIEYFDIVEMVEALKVIEPLLAEMYYGTININGDHFVTSSFYPKVKIITEDVKEIGLISKMSDEIMPERHLEAVSTIDVYVDMAVYLNDDGDVAYVYDEQNGDYAVFIKSHHMNLMNPATLILVDKYSMSQMFQMPEDMKNELTNYIGVNYGLFKEQIIAEKTDNGSDTGMAKYGAIAKQSDGTDIGILINYLNGKYMISIGALVPPTDTCAGYGSYFVAEELYEVDGADGYTYVSVKPDIDQEFNHFTDNNGACNIEENISTLFRYQKINNETNTQNVEGYIWPINNPKITCGWYCYAGHTALDMVNTVEPNGDVMAISDGVVIEVDYNETSGNYIVLDHGGDIVSSYQQLATPPILKVGDEVKQGYVIGVIGDSGLVFGGSHLHLSIEENGERVDPCNYLDCDSAEQLQ